MSDQNEKAYTINEIAGLVVNQMQEETGYIFREGEEGNPKSHLIATLKRLRDGATRIEPEVKTVLNSKDVPQPRQVYSEAKVKILLERLKAVLETPKEDKQLLKRDELPDSRVIDAVLENISGKRN